MDPPYLEHILSRKILASELLFVSTSYQLSQREASDGLQASSNIQAVRLQTLSGESLTVNLMSGKVTVMVGNLNVSTGMPLSSCRAIIYPVDEVILA